MLTNDRIALLVAVSLFCLAQLVTCWSHNPAPYKFNCPKLPPLSQPARNVHDLRPQDIKVVMALGDSITAGTLVHRIQELIKVYNILYASIHGITLPV